MMDIPGLNINHAEYFPYVYYKISLDFLEQDKRWKVLSSKCYATHFVYYFLDALLNCFLSNKIQEVLSKNEGF